MKKAVKEKVGVNTFTHIEGEERMICPILSKP